jgi:hypothetical protein
MPFVRDSRIKGLVFVPDDSSQPPKKHPCPDCHLCQMCPEIKCGLCMKRNLNLCMNCHKENSDSGKKE